MTNKRVIFFFTAIILLSIGIYLAIRYARGERINPQTKTLMPTGLLVASSIPNGASVYIDGKLKTATDDTLNLLPGQYQVEIKKDGFHSWKKELKIEKELVTKTNTYLFSSFPSLKSLTYTGATNPALSPDKQKVVFSVATSSASKRGLWLLDLINRPFGLSREPRQILQNTATKGRDFSQAQYRWSPDSKQILITLNYRLGKIKTETSQENFIIDTDKLTLESDLMDVTVNLKSLLDQWTKEETLRQKDLFSTLPKKLIEVLDGKVDQILFSPNEKKILYTATASATIPEQLISSLPASNSQPENRQLEPGKIYVYDLIEDKNFEINIKVSAKGGPASGGKISPVPFGTGQANVKNNLKKETFEINQFGITNLSSGIYLSWFPTSSHLFWVQENKVTVLEYDDTNWTDIYSGPFIDGLAFPFPDGDKFLILTSLGESSPTNLYAVSLR